jgi:predicted CopG family antitoxin
MTRRHTISINDEVYNKLRRKGAFGESYSQLIIRLIELAEINNEVKAN